MISRVGYKIPQNLAHLASANQLSECQAHFVEIVSIIASGAKSGPLLIDNALTFAFVTQEFVDNDAQLN